MRTRGKKTPTPKKGGMRTPTKESTDADHEEGTNFEETPETVTSQSPSEHVKSDEIPDVAKVDGDGGPKLEACGEVKPSDIRATTKVPPTASEEVKLESNISTADAKLEAAAEAEKKTGEDDAKTEEVDEEEEEDEEAEDDGEDEVEDEVEDGAEDEADDMQEGDGDEKVEGVQVEDEVEDEEEEVDYEDEEIKAQGAGNDTLKADENDDRTMLEIQDVETVSGRRKRKRLEVFVGGIDKDVSEDDLRTIFGKVGTITEIRMARNSQTGKNKGYAFVRYADPAEAKKAISELHGSQVGEKTCRVIPSEENDLLYLGNINKDWKKEKLVEVLNTYAIEKLEEVILLEDPQNIGKNRGYAFLEFTTHKDAMKAFNRLRQRDVVVGGDRTAKVAWAQPLSEPDEDTMAQVKNVFIDGLPPAWDEDQVKERFGKYGEIVRVVLGRNKSSSKRKDYGFVDYATREAALACIEAENDTEVGEGDQKVTLKVRLSKPVSRSRSGKGDIRGNFPIGKDGKGKISTQRARPGKKSSGKKPKASSGRRRPDMSRDKKSEFQKKSSLGAKGPVKKRSQFNNPVPANDSASRHRKSKFSSPTIEQRGSRRGRYFERDARSSRLPRRERVEDTYMYRRDEYVPDRRDSRGRKRGYVDLEDPRYVEVPQTSRSRPRLAHPDALQVAVGPQYTRLPYYETTAARAPVGHVAQYSVNQDVGLPGIPVQSYAVYDPLTGASGSSAYAAGGYPYGSVYSNGAEITRGPSYVPSTYAVPPPSGTRYSMPGANISRYY